MRLRELLSYDNIVIQCHDNPDADTIACGFGIYLYLTAHGKSPRLVYSGQNVIRKTNLVMLVQQLHIPLVHVDCVPKPELLVMVDCQYRAGNSAVFEAANVAVIDHHRVSTQLPPLSEVRSNLGACSTLLWDMLKKEQFPVSRELATALYYGLYTDTGGFAEIVHPLDRDLRDMADFDPGLMRRLRNANLSLEELEIAGAALLHTDYLEEYRAAVVKVAPCDPNILGIISDLVLEVDAVDICVTFNLQPEGVKFSVRSCVKEVKASELAGELSKGIGSGGGHLEKAGGLIPMELMTQEYLRLCTLHHFTPRMEYDAEGRHERPASSGIKSVLEQRLRFYMENTDIVYADACGDEVSEMESYCRRSVPWGYVRATDLFPAGSRINVRTMSGDTEATVEDGIFFLIGPKGELFFRQEEEFFDEFRTYGDWQFSLRDAEYAPSIRDTGTGAVVAPAEHAVVCVPRGKKTIRAKRLTRKVKLFCDSDENRQYTLGRIGDYMLECADTVNSIRVMRSDLFEEIYRRADETEAHRHVIFDLDGTLLYTLGDLRDAVNYALEKNGLAICTTEQIRAYVGNGVRLLVERAIGGRPAPFEMVFADFKEYYAAHCLDNTEPYPDILHLLAELHARGIRVAVVSNKLNEAVQELDDRFFGGLVQVSIGETAGLSKKPAPDMVEAALSRLGVSKEDAVYVGDSEVDLETAENAGLPCISVTWGFRDTPLLLEHGAKTLIQRPLELLYLI